MTLKIFDNENKNIYKDISYTIPSGIKLMNAKKMWDIGYTGKGVKIGILDTGCDINHICLSDRIVKHKNFTDVGKIDDVTDNVGHGTHVAGIIGANRHPKGITGVAPESDLYIAKVLNKNEGSYKSITEGIKWCIEEKVNIINMSLGGGEDDVNLHNAIKEAIKNNICIVCAGGNDGDGRADTIEIGYPAYYDETISVGAIDMNNRIAKFSDSNYRMDIVAYGFGVMSCFPGNRYAQMSGTSQASPMIAGTLALIRQWFMKEFHREPNTKELYAELIKNTITIPGVDRALQGNGRVYLSLN